MESGTHLERTTTWKKHLILRNKRNLPTNVYFKEDFCKEVLKIRKQAKSGHKKIIKVRLTRD